AASTSSTRPRRASRPVRAEVRARLRALRRKIQRKIQFDVPRCGDRISRMRNVALISVAILLGLAVTAPAQTTGHGVATPAAGDSGAVLDDLFLQLKRAGNEAAAQRISRLIRQQW